MKTKLFTLGLALLSIVGFSQAITEGFDDITTLSGSGWASQNLSSPAGTTNWFQGNVTFPAQAGATTAYIGANFNNTAGSGTISNWLFAPTRTLNNGDVFKFWTRSASATFPDRLEVRLSLNGTSTNAGASATSVGDFSTLLLSINPTLATTGATYPIVWTEYTITISGLSAATQGRIAFRYFVTDGGPAGNNSNYIGIDTFSYTPAIMSTINTEKAKLSIYPNPTVDFLKVNSLEEISSVAIFDASGKKITPNYDHNKIDVRSLKPGIYILKVTIGENTFSQKFIKK